MEHTFELVGGALCLDFANTVPSYLISPDERAERLPDYLSLLSWARQAQLADTATLVRLRRAAAAHPAAAARIVTDAQLLRAAIYDAFWAEAHDQRADAAALATLSRFHADARGHEQLRATADGQGYHFAPVDEDTAAGDDAPVRLDQLLGPIAHSAIELLTSARRERVRVCEASAEATCTWLFVDESKNHSRRWCSMRDCGNRAKVRRHAHKQRAGVPR
jgi:predicted RNA-binding Zn ribbon-like protein